jgi:glycosyltransferase involved in cell wall biosynthesis
VDVVWVSHLVPNPPIAGVLARSHHLLRAVAKRHRVHLISFVQQYWLELAFGSVEAGLEACRATLSEWVESITLLPIPSEQQRFLGRELLAARSLIGHPYTVRWLTSAEAHRCVRETTRRVKPRVTHLDTISLAQYRASITTGACTLGHHNIESHMLLRRAAAEANWAKRWYFRQEGVRLERYEARTARDFALHITCSALDAQRLRRIAGDIPIIDVPNGVDVAFFAPPAAPSPTSDLVFVGTMNWYPNVDAMRFFASEVWPTVRERHPESRFHMVGASPPADLQAVAAADSRFLVHGFVEDVREYAARAAVFVCPIRDGGGTKLKLLDAFAMGCAVVAHPLAVEGIEAVAGTHYLSATSADDFINAIARLLRDPALRASLGASARSLACTTYAFAALGDRFTDALERVA